MLLIVGRHSLAKYGNHTTHIDPRIVESVVTAEKNQRRRNVQVTFPELEEIGVKRPGKRIELLKSYLASVLFYIDFSCKILELTPLCLLDFL